MLKNLASTAVCDTDTLSLQGNTTTATSTPQIRQHNSNSSEVLELTNFPHHSLVVIDSRVDDAVNLAKKVRPNTLVLILDPDRDGIQQITEVTENLLQQSGIETIHIVCHGSPGCLYLGSTRLSWENVEQYRPLLQQWQAEEILLYGCNVAADVVSNLPSSGLQQVSDQLTAHSPQNWLDRGAKLAVTSQQVSNEFTSHSPQNWLDRGAKLTVTPQNSPFLQRLHQLTGANIAASSTPIGSKAQGGNWELDVTLGNIHSPLAFIETVQTTYTSIFAITGISVNSQDPQGLGSQDPAISSDGRFVVFESNADNLVPGDTNGVVDVFVYDSTTNITSIISIDPLGNVGDAASGTLNDGTIPAISENGRFVAFESTANNLVSTPTPATWDIFLRDRDSNTTTLISNNLNPNLDVGGNGDSRNPVISDNGQYVAFASVADNLVSGSANNFSNIFVNTLNGEPIQVSVGLNGNAISPAISADGRFVAFELEISATESQILLHDRDSNNNGIFDEINATTTQVLIDSETFGQNATFSEPTISADGRFVGFESLVPGDDLRIFVYDRDPNSNQPLSQVSVNSAGEAANGLSSEHDLSSDGRFVTFASQATNLVPEDIDPTQDIFIHDRDPDGNGIFENNGITRFVGGGGNSSFQPTLSNDGRFVAFESAANDLVANDLNNVSDVFIADTQNFVVTNTNDSGAGSLRQIILDANSNPGQDIITFNIPNVNATPLTIQLSSALPEITDPVMIDATSQPGFSGTPFIELSGGGLIENGLVITAGNSTVRGLVINSFTNSGIRLLEGDNNTIIGNYIGTDVTGNIDLGNGVDGIFLGSNTTGNVIGGSTPQDRNIISGNNRNGVQLDTVSNNIIQGNYIGTNAAGTADLGNSGAGIGIFQSSNNVVGGTNSGEGNLISGNDTNGIELNGLFSVGNLIQGNLIGTQSNGLSPLGNSFNGIQIFNGANSTSISPNIIAYNGQNGVRVEQGISNAIVNNNIFNNTNIGIDLGGDGITSNDLENLDLDQGPNDLQNYPTLITATFGGNTIQVNGILDSIPNRTFNLQFFSNNTLRSDNRQGQTLLGNAVVTTDAEGIALFNQTLNVNLSPDQLDITATATDNTNNNTSEFSAPITATGLTLDLDGDNSSTILGNNYATTFTEGEAPVAIADSDVTLINLDDSNIQSATITLTNPLNTVNESLSINGVLPLGITATGYDPTTGILQLSGSATAADYQTAISQIFYNNTAFDPDESNRLVEVVVNHGTLNSNIAQTTIEIIPSVNPVVGIQANINPTEEGTPGGFNLLLSEASNRQFTVPFDLIGSNAINSEDYTIVAGLGISEITPNSFTIEPGVTTASLEIIPVDDTVFEANETIQLNLTEGEGYLLNPTSNTATLTIIDNDTAEIILTPPADRITTEDEESATFNVALTSQPNDDVTINLSSSNSEEGTLSVESLVFTPENWNISRSVTVTGVDDNLADGDVEYTIITTPAVSNDPNYNTFDLSDLTFTNLDNDTVGINITPPTSTTTTEDGDSVSFGIVLASQPTADVTINLSSSNSEEGTLSVESLVFTPEDWNISRNITVTGVDDTTVDGNTDYTIATTVVSSDPNYNGIILEDLTFTNLDNDTLGINISPPTATTTTEDGDEVTFEIVLASQPTADVTITSSSDNPDEALVTSSPLSFTNLNWNIPQTVTVTGVDDDLLDGEIFYNIQTTVSSDDLNYSGIALEDVILSNLDNDVADVLISATSGLTTTEAGDTASFEVSLTSQPTGNVTLNLSSSNLNEGILSTSQVIFTPEDWETPQIVLVTGVDDPVADGDQAYTIITDAIISSDLNYNGINPDDVTVTNADNEIPGITITPITGLTTTEGEGSDAFEIILNTQPLADVTLGLSSSDITEGILSTAAVTFTPDNWNTPQVVTVTGVDDLVQDGDVNYSIITTPDLLTTDPNYNNFDPPDITLTNTDNDIAEILVTPLTGLTTTEDGGTANFDVVLTSQPIADVRLNFSSSNPNEGILFASEVVFTPENWSQPQTVTVIGQDDAIADGNLSYTIVTDAAISQDPNYNGFNPPDVSFTNADDETPGITVTPVTGLTTTEAGETATFTVVLNTQPTADVALNLSSSNPNEGVPSVSGLLFTPNNWSIPREITVIGVDDIQVDGEVEYSIITAPAGSNDPVYNGRNPSDVTLTNRDNDLPAVNLAINFTTAEEANTTTVTVTATASANVEGDQTVDLVVGGEGITATDYALSNTQITIPDGESTGRVSFRVVDDSRFEGNETAILTLANPSENLVLGTATTATVTIVDNDIPPTLEFSQTRYQVHENSEIVGSEIAINRLGDTSQASTVEVQLSNGTAEAEVDFDSTVIPVNFAANQTTAILNIPIIDDEIAEQNETFALALVNPSEGTSIGTQNTATVEILDNEVATINISQVEVGVSEGGVEGSYTLVLNQPPTSPVTIQFETDSQIAEIAQIIFDENNWNQPQTVTVQAIDDDQIEDRTHRSVIRHSVSSDDPNYDEFELANVEVEIAENDIIDVSIVPTTLSVTEEGETDNYQLVLTRQPEAPVTIIFNPEDQLNPIEDITFEPTDWNVPQTVAVSAIDDLAIEGEHIAAITHEVSSEDSNYNGLAIRAVTVSIEDNDRPGEVIFDNQTNLSVTEGENIPQTYDISLSSPPSSSVTINFETSAQLTPISAITFTENNWNQPQTVTVKAINNNQIEGNTTATISQTIITSAPNFIGTTIPDVSVEVIDDDAAGVLITQTGSRTTVSEAGTTDTYEVILRSQPTTNVRLTVTPDSQIDLGEGSENPIELLFTPENWNVPQTVRITAIDDQDVEAETHTSTINHAVFSNDPNYDAQTPILIDGTLRSNITVNIIENDEPLPPGTPDVNLIQPVRRLDVLEGFGSDVYKIVLNSEPTAEVNITISPDSQLQTNRQTLTFSPNNWNIPQTIIIQAVDDSQIESFITQSITHKISSPDQRYNDLSDRTISVNISDNDNLGEQTTFLEPSIESLTEQDDRIIASAFDDIIFANLGHDRISGEGGFDYIAGQGGTDGLSGNAGDDILLGGQGDDQIEGNEGNDVIFGDRGSDRLWGREGNDQLFGGFGNDRLVGNKGGDTLTGGLGNDAFVIGFGSGGNSLETADQILDFTDTQDVIELVSPLTFDQLDILPSPNGTVIQIASTGEVLVELINITPDQLNALDFV